MAMTQCRECKEAVSSQAKTCPNCGIEAPSGGPTPAAKGCLILLAIVLGVPFIGGLCSGISGEDPEPSSISAPKKKVSNATPTQNAAQKRAKEAACRQELSCYAEKHLLSASIRCQRTIEGMARYDFEWTDGWLGGKFTHFRWKNQKKGIVTYIGDEIKMQNGFGAWQKQIYSCDFDPSTDLVLDANVEAGRIPR